MKHASIDAPAPTDPGKRTARTALAVAVASLIGLVLVLPEILTVLDEEIGVHLPPEMRLWLLGTAALVTSIASAVTRVMAIPAVNQWLSRWTPFGTLRPSAVRAIEE